MHTKEPPDLIIPAAFTAAELRAIARALSLSETIADATGVQSFGARMLKRRVRAILRQHGAEDR